MELIGFPLQPEKMNQELSHKIRRISFLLMGLICFIHAYNINSPGWQSPPPFWLSFLETFVSDGICRSAVPMFFAISGFLAGQGLPEKFTFQFYGKLLDKKVKSLLIPYLLVSLMGILLVLALQISPLTSSFIQGYQIDKIKPVRWLYIWILSPVPYPLWFVRFLYLYFVIFPFIYFLTRYFKVVYLLASFILWMSFFWQARWQITKTEAEGLFFFSLGLFWAIEKLPLQVKVKPWTMLVLVLGWMGWIAFRSQHIILHPFDHGVNHYNLIGFTFLGFGICWLAYDFLPQKVTGSTFLNTRVPFAIGIFLFHEPLLTMIKKAMIKVSSGQPLAYFLAYFLAPILAFWASCLFSKVFSRNLPRVYAVFTGNRAPKQIG